MTSFFSQATGATKQELMCKYIYITEQKNNKNKNNFFTATNANGTSMAEDTHIYVQYLIA